MAVLHDKVSVVCTGMDSEELYFARQEQEKMMALRSKAQKESDDKYREEHKYHCFRCGTNSLVEVNHGGIKIDVCVNEGCGAVHLDRGELEQLGEKDYGAVKSVSVAVLRIFR